MAIEVFFSRDMAGKYCQMMPVVGLYLGILSLLHLKHDSSIFLLAAMFLDTAVIVKQMTHGLAEHTGTEQF